VHLDRERQQVQRDGEGLVHDGLQDFLRALLAVDLQPLLEAELVEDVQPDDMVEVEVAEEKVDRQIVVDVAVGLVDAVARVEDDVVLFRVDECADGVAGVGVVPAVGAEEDDLHAYFSASLMGIMLKELKDFLVNGSFYFIMIDSFPRIDEPTTCERDSPKLHLHSPDRLRGQNRHAIGRIVRQKVWLHWCMTRRLLHLLIKIK